MQKKLYRTLSAVLDTIDDSEGQEQTLLDVLHALVEGPDIADFGVTSGRLFRERKRDYVLIESLGEDGPELAGQTISKDYQIVKDIERHRLWIISPDSPGFDPELESQFSPTDSAAINFGHEPRYILSLGIDHRGEEDDVMVLLGTIRAAVGLKLREEALAGQMRRARTIQHSLLPRRLPKLEGFDLAAASVPADEVGGDVYDLQMVEDGVMGVLMADASGHGLPAALQARDVIIGMRMGQAEHQKISTTVTRLNRVIHRSSLASRFISLFYAELEATGNMAYVNGGHCPPLLLTPTDDVFELKTCGPVLGPLPDAEYRRGYLTLRPGEVLVIFTDGVTERLGPAATDDDPDEFGRDGLVDTVRRHADRPAAEIARVIMEEVRAHGDGAPLDDDVSVMVIKRVVSGDYPPADDLTRLAPESRR
ncbi:MAG: PP2C family protein-serine/threonine phosphatase [bacterium]|nr:PP2C family protein-serine/threonine phosphatase [bacterium]